MMLFYLKVNNMNRSAYFVLNKQLIIHKFYKCSMWNIYKIYVLLLTVH